MAGLYLYVVWLQGKKLHQEIDAQQERIATQARAEECLRNVGNDQ